MKRVGIGGMQMFDGSLGTPQFVENRLVWMTPRGRPRSGTPRPKPTGSASR